MNIKILHAEMNRTEEGYLGKVHVEVEHHKEPYEIALHSKSGRDWGYSLYFLHQSGPEEEIDALDRYLEEDDDAFDRILEAAEQALS